MQREIKKRASLYGVSAILLAVILTAFCYRFGVIPGFQPSPEQPPAQPSGFLNTFSSEEELRRFLVANSRTQGAFLYYGPPDVRVLGQTEGFAQSAPGLKLYSTTNVQVVGVDESDIVKTDGAYIYALANNTVYVLKAYPAGQAEVLSKISFKDSYPVGIFVNGDRLAVLGSIYTQYSPYPMFESWSYYRPYYVDIKTFVDVYDISNRANPAFLTNFTISGSYFSSRMIGDYVYFVASQPAYVIFDTVVLPKIYAGNGFEEIPASEIRYSNASDDYYQYTTIVAMNVQNTTEEPTHETIMLGGTSTMYVSLSNIYITFPDSDWQQTSIYRIRIENSTIQDEARGKVLGRELNQFSMDEYDDYFRIATTTWVNGTSENNLYVLNMNLSLVGSLENLAPPNEVMDSARFIGNRCYLSTSVVRRDPFFVIDVENASEPKVLGDLKIPGFTRYLHPYDDDHVIGLGMDGSNVKITLFDVSNVSAPINMSEYKVQGSWSNTEVLTDHKAFLFDKSKELLVIPISITVEYYSGMEWQASCWQGTYIFNVTLTSGLTLRGNVTHLESGTNGWDSYYWITRALYIEDVLYTMSEKMIKMNSLNDLALLNKIEFSPN